MWYDFYPRNTLLILKLCVISHMCVLYVVRFLSTEHPVNFKTMCNLTYVCPVCGTIFIHGTPCFDWWNYVIRFLMLMLKISRDRWRQLVVKCSTQNHLITLSQIWWEFQMSVPQAVSFFKPVSNSIRQMSEKMSTGENKLIIVVYFASW